jgi:rod shape determining protein RodA
MIPLDDLNATQSRRTLTFAARILKGLHLDGPLLTGILMVCAVGLVVLYSAGSQNPDLIIRQVIRICVALVVMLVVAQVPPNYLRMWSP